MKYLQEVFEFLGKHFLLALPMIIAVAIPNIITGTVNNAEILEGINELSSVAEYAQMDSMEMLRTYLEIMKPWFTASTIAGIVSFLLSLFVVPATYGMVNKGLETGNADLGDFFPQMAMNLPKFIIYKIFNFLVDTVLSLAFMLILALFIFLLWLLKEIGTSVLFLGIAITFVVAVMLYVVIYGIKCILSYWYPAMLVDSMKVTSAFKKAVEVGRSCLWQTVGITFLISMANFFITVTLKNFANTLPRVGIYLEPVLISIPSGLAGFILLAFYLAVYRDKTRKMEDKDVDIFESPGEFV
ncbi:MAG TPA: hypothetical protein DEF39_13570 [Hungateiclostridium thermocellum]|uniref:Uncharacterized protein n=3 Tax=Acetivibrio thermocellus TaxID=1515 RepID=A3DES3_ACET2|nr:hypothetical protein [Acetivibrio thermocellus]CDG35891.1 hypothetical protein CTHBC1_1244 [Acetivibrio thermocellus BC1]ABN52452.1 hypothetical protein Cthe_1220 [Acetivibrio thermocellus ATCC 27405]ADU74105.1 hypothetical protein Clo1313_1037 [Acetivibrio thermocellus DSM 1313]ALX08043.1 hypothetical protein AD2_01048 [Acetivibrio thermocellus AD2]ANV75790.1 hypothetical protein LQRI_1049 [Acetivibrio thermocellus DSM 2360]